MPGHVLAMVYLASVIALIMFAFRIGGGWLVQAGGPFEPFGRAVNAVFA